VHPFAAGVQLGYLVGGGHQAIVERLTLLTADTTLKRYGRFVRVV